MFVNFLCFQTIDLFRRFRPTLDYFSIPAKICAQNMENFPLHKVMRCAFIKDIQNKKNITHAEM